MEQSFLDQTRVFGKGQSFPIFINDKDFIVAEIDDSSFAHGAECCYVGETAQIEILLKDNQGCRSDNSHSNVELCYLCANRITYSHDWNVFETLNSVFSVNFKAEKNVVYVLKKGEKEIVKALLIQKEHKKITNFRVDSTEDAKKFWNDEHFRELNKQTSISSEPKALSHINVTYSFAPAANLSDVLIVDEGFKSSLKFVLSQSESYLSIAEVKQWLLEQFEAFQKCHKDQGLLMRLNHGVITKFDSLFHVSFDDENLRSKKYLLIRLLGPRVLGWIRSLINDSSNYSFVNRAICKSFQQFSFGEAEVEKSLQRICQKVQLLQYVAEKRTFGLVICGAELSGRTTVGTLLLDRLISQHIKVDMKSLLYNSRGLKFDDIKVEFEKKIAESLPRRKIAFLLENIEEMSSLGETDSSGFEKQMITHYFCRLFKEYDQEIHALF